MGEKGWSTIPRSDMGGHVGPRRQGQRWWSRLLGRKSTAPAVAAPVLRIATRPKGPAIDVESRRAGSTGWLRVRNRGGHARGDSSYEMSVRSSRTTMVICGAFF